MDTAAAHRGIVERRPVSPMMVPGPEAFLDRMGYFQGALEAEADKNRDEEQRQASGTGPKHRDNLSEEPFPSKPIGVRASVCVKIQANHNA